MHLTPRSSHDNTILFQFGPPSALAAAGSHSTPHQSLHVPGTSSLTGSKSASNTAQRELDSRLSDLLGSGDDWDEEDSAEKEGIKGVERAANGRGDTTQPSTIIDNVGNTKARYTYMYVQSCIYTGPMILRLHWYPYSEVKNKESGPTPVSALMFVFG